MTSKMTEESSLKTIDRVVKRVKVISSASSFPTSPSLEGESAFDTPPVQLNSQGKGLHKRKLVDRDLEQKEVKRSKSSVEERRHVAILKKQELLSKALAFREKELREVGLFFGFPDSWKGL